MLRTDARGRGRGQFFEAESKAEDKILASRPAYPRRLNITFFYSFDICYSAYMLSPVRPSVRPSVRLSVCQMGVS